VLAVRHGETAWNRSGRLQGTQDVPLSEFGRRQAARNGRAIRPLLEAADWRIVASPLRRCVETAAILLAASGREGAEIRLDERLREVSFGAWEGLTLRQAKARDPEGMARREASKWTAAPPQGESYREMTARVASFAAERTGPTLVVAHGGTLRALLHLLCGLPGETAVHHPAPQDRAVLFVGGRAVLV